MRNDIYLADTLNGNDDTVDYDIEDRLDEIAVETPTDKELAKLQKMLLSNGNIADFLSDI